MAWEVYKATETNLRAQITAHLRALAALISGAVSDTAYDATTWNGVTTVAPSKNAVRDKLETMVAEADYDANTILAANTDNTPLALTVAEQTLVGRITGGNIDDLSVSQVRTLLALVSDDAYDSGWNGVTDVAPSKNAVYDKIETIVSNVTHTGEVTGATALTLDKTAITNRTDVALASGDYILYADASDSFNLKKADATAFLPLGGNITPNLWDDSLSSSESQTYTVQGGKYRTFGDLVYFHISLTVNSLGSLTTSQQARIGPLPFTATTTTDATPIYVGLGTSLAITAGVSVTGLVPYNSNYIGLHKWSATTGTTPLTIAELSTGGQLILSGFYIKQT